MKKSYYFGLLLVIFLSGCSMKNNFDVVLPENYQLKKQFDYKLANVNVQIASEKEKTGDLDIFSATYSSSFEQSLSKVLREIEMFNGKSGEALDIKALVLKNDAPIGGFTMTIDTDILYIIRTHNGEIIYKKIISAQGSATVSDEFVAIKRAILANDRAIQNNIRFFIDDVQVVLQNYTQGMQK